MRAVLLCCLVALAVCEVQLRYDLNLNPKKIYEYDYEGQVRIGLDKPNRAESGVRMKSRVNISGHSTDIFLLQFSHVEFDEFNGISGKSDFVKNEDLKRKISEQLTKPITFHYSAGIVNDIHASATEVTDTVVNIVRGFLGFFQFTIKTRQDIYELEEVGIHGKCLNSYAIKTNDAESVMDLTQVVDVTNCREKAAFYSGLATAVEDKDSQKRGDSLFSTVKYNYNIKGKKNGGLITKAQAVEVQLLSPFNVKHGTFRMELKKQLVLRSEPVDVSNSQESQDSQKEQVELMDSRGSLMFKIVKDNANIPVTMQKLDDPVPKAKQLIKSLAQANAQNIDSTTTEDAIKVYQLLRKISLDKLKEMWSELKGNPDERRWFLHTVVEVNDDRILDFLELYLSETENCVIEAITVIVQAFSHLDASSDERLDLAKKFLNKNYHDPLIRQTVVLSYGSLVFKHCAYHKPCPVAAITPLLDMADQAYRGEDEKEKILVLKALGNAGHPNSLKTIIKFLPGVDPNPDKVDRKPRVVSAAVQAMRLITVRDPHGVQENTLKLFLNRELEAELRMLAVMMMFDSKPSMALVSTVTAHLLEETNMQVVNFTFSYLRSLAKATTPEKHHVSTAASVAVKILAPKFGHLSYIQSRAIRMDWFHDDYLMGTATEAFILKRVSQLIPAEMMVKQNFYFIGRILQLLELGIRPEGLRELFGASIPGFKGDISMSDFHAVYDVLKKWETLPEDKPLFSFYTRVSGQEFFFSDISKDLLMNFSKSAGSDSFLWKIIEKLIAGFSWRAVLPFMTAEVRYIQATSLGLPVEISKYYHVVNGMRVTARSEIHPQMTERLGELLNAKIKMHTDGYIGYTKDLWFTYGINTDLFQSGVEIKTTNPVTVPFHFDATVDFPTKQFELEIPQISREFEVFSIRSNAYAISRNIMHPEAYKKSQIVPSDHSDQSLNQKYSQIMQKNEPNRWHPVEESCYENCLYGFSLCTEMELKREYYQEEYPLYYILGYTHYAIKVKPVPSSNVEKIRLVMTVEPSNSSVSVRDLINGLRKMAKEGRPLANSASQEQQDRPSRGITGSPVPLVRVEVLANSSSVQSGYNAYLYYTPDSYSTKLIMSYVGDSSNWKMCMDAAMETEAEVLIGWGNECKTHTMSMRAAHVTGNRPELKAVFHWGHMPEEMKKYGRRIARYTPGIAYLMGFNQEEKTNAREEVSASFIAASADSIDVKIEFPEFSLCREALPSPVQLAYFLYSNKTINSNTQA